MSESLPEPERPWRLYLSLGVAALLILVSIFFTTRRDPAGEAEENTRTAEADAQRQCEEQLAGILAALDPRELGLSSSQSDRAHDLNLWRTDCGAHFGSQNIAEDEALLERLLPPETVARIRSETFVARDAAHVRTTLLMRQAAQHVTDGINGPIPQAVALFDFVQRNVLEIGADAPTLTPYEILLLGRGSSVQRGWLFAELLRQIELDAVIVQSAANTSPDAWLIGVPISDKEAPGLYLFDPLLGLPIPADSEATATTVSVAQPATLAEIRARDELLRRLDLPEAPYRLKAADFAEVRIGLIGHSSLWSNRVATLDFATELRGAIFYDGLGKNRLREPSLFERVAAAGQDGGWKEQDIFVWEVPESELAAFGTSAAKGAVLLANYQAVLSGPVIREIANPMTGQNLVWNHPLIAARNLHIAGIYAEAVREYNQIRSGVSLYTIDPLNDLCRESAVYWTTCCQFERGEFDSVINTALRGHYPPGFFTGVQPIWPDGMLRLAAFGMAHSGAYPEAATLLQQAVSQSPHGYSYLIRRWQRLASPPGTPAESAPSPAPATEVPATNHPPAAETPAAGAPAPATPAAADTSAPPADNTASPAPEPPAAPIPANSDAAPAGDASPSTDSSPAPPAESTTPPAN